ALSVLTSATALVPVLGWTAWLGHQLRLFRTLGGFLAGTLLTDLVPTAGRSPYLAVVLHGLVLGAWLLPTLWLWGRRNGWGGLRNKVARRTDHETTQ
ncbi:hypothetical protein ACYOEI_17225, partial [Singulisphaera rosea]